VFSISVILRIGLPSKHFGKWVRKPDLTLPTNYLRFRTFPRNLGSGVFSGRMGGIREAVRNIFYS
jgi:hypothetical protein